MVDAKQLETRDLSWFRPRGPYVQQRRAQGTVLLSTGGACSGAARSKAGEEAWLPSPWLNILWENWRMSTWCVVCYLTVSCPLPAAGGFAPLL
jgi:hypothetical protein